MTRIEMNREERIRFWIYIAMIVVISAFLAAVAVAAVI
jgi:hypothetical protein